MSEPTNSKPRVQPFILSKQDIDSIPLENFSGNEKRATGGWRQIFSSPETPTDSLNIGIAHFPPRRASQESFEALHRHKQAEFYYILSGQAVVKIEGVDYDVVPGHALFIPGDAEHGFWNTSTEEELVFIWGFAVDGFRDVVYRFTGDADTESWRQVSK
jgi:mannose-6-phosphate isomerase-like protein (cupin superfamily)